MAAEVELQNSTQLSDPTPIANSLILYPKSDSLWIMPPGGTAVDLGAGGGGGGETNTGSNVGTDGIGVFDGKVASDLQFRHVAPASTKISVVLNGADIDVDVVEGNLVLGSISGSLANDAAHGSRGGGTQHAGVTTTVNGFMIAADKLRFDGIPINGAGQLTGTLDASDNDITNLNTATFNGLITPTVGVTTTIDWSTGAKQQITLDQNTALAFTDPAGPASGLRLLVIQDGTGGWSLTQPGPNVVKASNGNLSAPSAAAGTQTLYMYDFDGTDYIATAITNLQFV